MSCTYYIYTLLIYSGLGKSGPAPVGAGLIYMSCKYYIYIYIYVLLIYSGGASGHASVGAGLIYMSCTYYIYTLLIYSGEASGPATVGAGLIYMSCTYYIYIHCLYIQVMLLVLLLSAQDLFTCLAHIYIYTLLVYSGDASGHASVGAGLIYMSCTYYIYIYCLLLVLLLSAQDLFTCLANLPHLYQ